MPSVDINLWKTTICQYIIRSTHIYNVYVLEKMNIFQYLWIMNKLLLHFRYKGSRSYCRVNKDVHRNHVRRVVGDLKSNIYTAAAELLCMQIYLIYCFWNVFNIQYRKQWFYFGIFFFALCIYCSEGVIDF